MWTVVGKQNRNCDGTDRRTMFQVGTLATVYRQLGVDTRQQFLNTAGRPISILSHGEPIRELIT